MRDSAKVIIILSISFLLVTLEHSLSGALGFSGLLAVMGMGIALQRRRGGGGGQAVRQILQALGGCGAAAVRAGGSTVDVGYALASGGAAVLLIFGVLVFRMAGVFLCLLGTVWTAGNGCSV